MGLINRLVPTGKGRESAEQLAHELAALPQRCMLSDRKSVYSQWGQAMESALSNEFRLGMETLSSGELLSSQGRPACPSMLYRRISTGEGRNYAKPL